MTSGPSKSFSATVTSVRQWCTRTGSIDVGGAFRVHSIATVERAVQYPADASQLLSRYPSRAIPVRDAGWRAGGVARLRFSPPLMYLGRTRLRRELNLSNYLRRRLLDRRTSHPESCEVFRVVDRREAHRHSCLDSPGGCNCCFRRCRFDLGPDQHRDSSRTGSLVLPWRSSLRRSWRRGRSSRAIGRPCCQRSARCHAPVLRPQSAGRAVCMPGALDSLCRDADSRGRKQTRGGVGYAEGARVATCGGCARRRG